VEGRNACQVFPDLLPGKALDGQRTRFRLDVNFVMLQSISLFADMIEDFERDIRLTGVDEEEQEFHSLCIPGILQALSPELYSLPWPEVRRRIADVDMVRLEGVDMFLRRFIKEQHLYPVDFEPIQSSIDEAIRAIESADLPSALKDLILTRLADIKVSIVRYRFRGVDGIQETLAAYAGTLSMSASTLESNLPVPAKTSLRGVLSTAKDLFEVAHGVAWIWPFLTTGVDLIRGFLP
jgi:hypothetical protein